MEMKNAQSLGIKLNQDEVLLVDSFSYLSNKTKTTWIGFLTNQRFILKQANVSLTGMGVQDGLFQGDFSYVPLAELRGLKLKKGRLVIDGDVYSNGKDFSEYGSYGSGLMGGLSYSSGEEVYRLLLNNLSKLGEKYGFYLWTPEAKEHNTASAAQQQRLTKIVVGDIVTALKICGAVIGVAVVLSTLQNLWPLYLFAGCIYAFYRFRR